MSDNEIGDHIADDPRGLLRFNHLPDDLARAEDATMAADHERITEGMFVAFTRAATDTERGLLNHLGHSLPDTLSTHVAWLSNGLRRRTWPQLEGKLT